MAEQTEVAVTAQKVDVEQGLCKLFGDVLGVSGVDIHDDFFELGGHSLLASRLARNIHTEFGTKISMRVVYEAPTPEALARRLGLS